MSGARQDSLGVVSERDPPAFPSEQYDSTSQAHVWDPYVAFLTENRDKRFYRKPYPGNAGDALISMGTQILLARLGIQETTDPYTADVILMPGGNPAAWQSVHVELWRQIWKRFPDKQFVVGPAGFAYDSLWRAAIFENLSHVTALFARDAQSYSTLESAGFPPSIRLALAHDPALHLRGSSWLEAHRRATTREFVLIGLRDDHETNVLTSAITRYLPGRFGPPLARMENRYRKRSKLARAMQLADPHYPVRIQDITKQNIDLCVETVREAAEVHTDRLHLLLLAVMLGKKVFAYPTSYNKLESVFENSLKGWADVEIVSQSSAVH